MFFFLLLEWSQWGLVCVVCMYCHIYFVCNMCVHRGGGKESQVEEREDEGEEGAMAQQWVYVNMHHFGANIYQWFPLSHYMACMRTWWPVSGSQGNNLVRYLYISSHQYQMIVRKLRMNLTAQVRYIHGLICTVAANEIEIEKIWIISLEIFLDFHVLCPEPNQLILIYVSLQRHRAPLFTDQCTFNIMNKYCFCFFLCHLMMLHILARAPILD